MHQNSHKRMSHRKRIVFHPRKRCVKSPEGGRSEARAGKRRFPDSRRSEARGVSPTGSKKVLSPKGDRSEARGVSPGEKVQDESEPGGRHKIFPNPNRGFHRRKFPFWITANTPARPCAAPTGLRKFCAREPGAHAAGLRICRPPGWHYRPPDRVTSHIKIS